MAYMIYFRRLGLKLALKKAVLSKQPETMRMAINSNIPYTTYHMNREVKGKAETE